MSLKDDSFDDLISKKLTDLSQNGGDIRKVFMLGQELLKQNPNQSLIDLSLGNPDLDPPPALQENLISLLSHKQVGAHRYMDAAGLFEVRDFLAAELTKSENVPVSADSVYMTVGAAGGLQILLRTFLDQGDEVIVFSPYFPEYISYVKNLDGIPIVVPSDENHQPLLHDFEKSLSEKTKVVILNSPNNPTGVIYTEEILIKMFEIIDKKNKETGKIIQIISDEPYARIAYEGKKIPKILSMYEFSWVVRSFSKDLALAGERIGFIAWRQNLLKKFNSIQNQFRNASRIIGFVNSPRLMQRLLPLVFHYKVDVSLYEKRVISFINILNEFGVPCVAPEAGFFVFPKSPIDDDRIFCEMLVNKGVLCVPGSGFGCSGYFRASLVHDQSVIEQAAKRIGELNNSIKSNS